MPKFYFNVRTGNALIHDESGKSLPDIETAREVARENARHLRRTGYHTAGPAPAIEITDSLGRVIDIVEEQDACRSDPATR